MNMIMSIWRAAGSAMVQYRCIIRVTGTRKATRSQAPIRVR